MRTARRILTLDSNVFIAALKADEPYGDRCAEIISKVPGMFILSEPSIVYQEVCGTLARRVGMDVASSAKSYLDQILQPRLVVDCSAVYCVKAYPLCSEFNIYAMDALYLRVALDSGAIIVSLDKEHFIDRVKQKNRNIEAYHVSEFPY
ncbi:MAG: type II toxin-antitoxin system VapC family toxin [Thermoproteota archaeon]